MSIWALNTQGNIRKRECSTCNSGSPRRRGGETVVACLVQAADAISAARPGARRENVQNYIKRLEKLEEIATSFEGVEKSFAIQAGREIRIMVKPEVISDDQMALVAREVVKRLRMSLNIPVR